jgi:uncharacterized protein (TIGR00299 family) protein
MKLWLNPVSGISGDMLLGALLDLGAPLDWVNHAIASTGLTGWSLEQREVRRCGLRATHAVVTVTDTATERQASELFEIVRRAPREVREVAGEAILRLARVEAGLHGTTVDDVHLHELGGIDTVVDLVGVAAALHALGITSTSCATVRLGHGTVECAHGELPVPSPATLELLAGFPVAGVNVHAETVTPTGAALLAALAPEFGELPAMTLRGTGYGAGSRDLPGRPNVLPAVVGSPTRPVGDPPWVTEALTVVETTVDDVSGEILADTADQLRRAGALDVWTTPALGKKGRPAHVISALVCPEDRDVAVATLTREIGTLGVRSHEVLRTAAPRTTTTVEVGGHRVDVKVGPYGAKPEYEHVRAAARDTGRSVAHVAATAVEAWRASERR